MKRIFLLFGALVASLPACASSIEQSSDEPVESQESAQTDPFDANWLQGTPITVQEAASWFSPGGRYAYLGRYEIHARERACNTTTGCTAWTGKWITTFPGTGRIEAIVDDQGKINIELGGTVCDASNRYSLIGATCGNVGTSATANCGRYKFSHSSWCGAQDVWYAGFEKTLGFEGRVTKEGIWQRSTVSSQYYYSVQGSPAWTETDVILIGRFVTKRPHESWSRDNKLRATLKVGQWMPWEEANAHCKRLGGRIGTIGDPGFFGSENRPWTDARRTPNGFVSQSQGNAPWLRTDWHPGEPNNSGGVEDCVERLEGGQLNDLSCAESRPYACIVEP